MRTAKFAFNQALLKKMSADPTKRGADYTDAGCRNLSIYIARDGVVTFTFRKRVKDAPKGRIFEGLGTWSSAFTLDQARDMCAVRRTELSQDGFKPKAEKKTVLAAIPLYEEWRQLRTPLRPDWPEYLARFKKVFPNLLARDVNTLREDDFLGAISAYGRTEYTAKGKEWDWRVLRPMLVCMMPMLRWYTKRFRMDPNAIENILPPDYDKDTRYLLPGEWQACAPHVDALDGLDTDCGLFERFVLYTCARSEQALGMEWDEVRWGQWQTWKDADGREHRALIWIPPRERMKGRMKAGGEKLPRRVLITGESLVVLEKLRAIWEANVKLPEYADWNKVFTKQMIHRWRTARTSIQRGIEKKGGTKPWDRMTLRHTHATWLQGIGCPARLITMSMNHTPDRGGSAAVTNVYAGADPARRFMQNDPLAELAPWHLRLHKLIRDIERGNIHNTDLTVLQENMRDGQGCRDMCEDYGINRRFIEVEETKLRAVK